MNQKTKLAYVVLLVIIGVLFLLINSQKTAQITGEEFYSPTNLIITILVFVIFIPVLFKINKAIAKKENENDNQRTDKK